MTPPDAVVEKQIDEAEILAILSKTVAGNLRRGRLTLACEVLGILAESAKNLAEELRENEKE